MADALDAVLALDTSEALSALQALADETASALDGVAQDFGASFESVVSGLPPVDVEADATAVPPEVEEALGSVDGAVPVEAEDTETLTADVDSALEEVDGVVPVEADAAGVPDDVQTALDSVDGVVAVEADASGVPAEIDAAVDAADPPEVVIEADTGNLESTLDSVTGASSDASGSLTGLASAGDLVTSASSAATGSAAGLGAAIGSMSGEAAGAVGIITGVALATNKMFQEAVDAQGAAYRLDQTMGPLAARINTINVGSLNMDLSELALILGSDDDAMREAASSSFVMATSFGKGKEESADFSAGLLAIASRAVALNPSLGDVGSAATRLQRALQTGRDRALQPYALGLSKAQIASRALEIAMADGRAEANASDKAFAGVQLATEKWGATLNDTIIQGSKNPTIVLRALKQEVIENIEALGMPLVVPIFELMESGIPVALQFGRVIADVAQAGLPLLTTALRVVEPLVRLLADALGAIPTPLLTAGLALAATARYAGLLQSGLTLASGALGKLPIGAGAAQSALGGLSGGLSGLSGWLTQNRTALIGVGLGAGIAASSFDGMGKSTADTAMGIGGMALAGASLGSMVMPGLGTAVGATAGVIAGAAVTMFKGGESADEYGQRIAKLSKELDGLAANKALDKFTSGGAIEGIFGASAAVLSLTRDVEELAKTSPTNAQKVVDAFVAMREESGKPLSTKQIDALNDAVDRGSESYAKRTVEVQKSKAADDAAAAGAAAAAQQETNATAMTNAKTAALKAHTEALAQSTSNYAALALATQTQTQLDQNAVAIASQQALASRSATDAQAAVNAEVLSGTVAFTGAHDAVIRYQQGTGTAKEAIDALNAAQTVLNQTLDLSVGRYVSQEQAEIASKNAIDQVNQGLADHAGALGLDSAEGRENYNALLSATQSQLAYSQAILASTGDIGAALAPLQVYRGQLVAWRDQLAAEGNAAGAGLVDNLIVKLDGGIAQIQARTPIFNASGQQIGTAVVTGGADGSSNLGEVILNNVGQAEAGVGGQVPAFDAQGRAIGSATSAGGDAGIKALAQFLGDGVLNALNSAGIMGANAHNVGYGIGVKLIDGVGAGMDAESGWLVSKAAGIIDRTVAAMRTAAANASPSKRTRDEVGIPMAQGIAVGLLAGIPAITAATADAVAAARAALPESPLTLAGAFPAGHSMLPTARRGGGHTYIDFNINVAGVNDDRMARIVGEQLGAGAVDALTRRGIVVKARVG